MEETATSIASIASFAAAVKVEMSRRV